MKRYENENIVWIFNEQKKIALKNEDNPDKILGECSFYINSKKALCILTIDKIKEDGKDEFKRFWHLSINFPDLKSNKILPFKYATAEKLVHQCFQSRFKDVKGFLPHTDQGKLDGIHHYSLEFDE